jgi:hypothetical protein
MSTGLHDNVECLLPRGTVLTLKLKEDLEQEYFLYIPRKGGDNAPFFVTIHGITRNAEEHAQLFLPLTERYGCVLVAPLFPKERFHGYQRLGHKRGGARADLVIKKIISEVGNVTGARIDKLYMFGYSGGGQFVHRYAMAYPGEVSRIAIASAGWYTLPDPTVDYPYGIKCSNSLREINFNPAQFLTIPALVMVGENDVHRDPELRKSDLLDHQQGMTRLDRGKRWTKIMSAAAKSLHLKTPYFFQILPSSNHSFEECMRKGNMGERVFEFLFDHINS